MDLLGRPALSDQDVLLDELEQLRRRALACWCAPLPRHGDTLPEMANMVADMRG